MSDGYSDIVNCLKRLMNDKKQQIKFAGEFYHAKSFLSPSILKNSTSGMLSRILETVKTLCIIIEQKAQLDEKNSTTAVCN